MKRLLLITLALAAGCGGKDYGFAVALTLQADSPVGNDVLSAVTRLAFVVTGDESGEFDDDVSGIHRTERVIYLPKLDSREVTLNIEAQDIQGIVLLSGSTGQMELDPDKTLNRTVELSAPNASDDMAVSDGGSTDAALDALPSRDLSPAPCGVEGGVIASGNAVYLNATQQQHCMNGTLSVVGCPSDTPACRVTSGQCYDPSWSTWPLPTPGPVQSPTPSPSPSPTPNPRYTILGANSDIVRDELTHLVWQRGVAPGDTWQNAIAYCESLNLDGVTGWRLPTRIELISIVDYSRSQPAIDLFSFPGSDPYNTWAVNAYAQDPSLAWTVQYVFGNAYVYAKTQSLNIRCVR